MSSFRHFLLLTLFIVQVMIFPSSALASNKQITVSYSDNWAPYSYLNNDVPEGILVRMMNELLGTRLNYQVDSIVQPWARAQQTALEGRADAIFTAITPERTKSYQPSKEALFYLDWRIFVSVNSSKYDEMTNSDSPLDIKNLRFIIVNGDSTSEKILSEQGVPYIQVSTIQQCLKMLQFDRADAFLHSNLVGKVGVLQLELTKEIVPLKGSYGSIPFVFLLSNNSKVHPKINNELDTLVKNLKDSGEFQKISSQIEAEVLLEVSR
ncbi:transporter substrate-binding domain-containing protein [Vibrio kyushuensis]|uniref:substrate-binding periplasmic protein n=1 Tax=Vibrio kyushuensis TaxID=2910249 RepID=UPI003D110221